MTAAEAYAVVENGQIRKIVVTKPDSGYSSPPEVKVKGFENVRFEANVQYEKDCKKNGAIESIAIVTDDKAAQ